MGVAGVQVDDHDHGVRPLLLGEREHVLVRRLQDRGAVEVLQGRIRPPGLVQRRGERQEGPVEPALADSYFSESRYSSLPTATGTFSQLSKPE